MLGALQENIVCLLSYDEERAPIIRGVVDPSLFGGPMRTIVARIYDYIDKYKKPPKDHLPDILSDKLEAGGREASLYEDIILSIKDTHSGINAEYVMAQLQTFIERQSLRSVAIDIAKALQRDTDESLAEAKKLFSAANTQSLSLFDPGTKLGDPKKTLEFLEISTECFPTGIPELDKRGFGPTRKELWLYIANTKAGKTWALINLAKMAVLHRLKVCHITLEMSEARSAQRYLQSFFAMAKRKEPLQAVKFQKDELGRITGFDDIRITPSLSMDDPRIRSKLEKRIKKWAPRGLDNIIVKQFPTGTLTVNQLVAYLDNLEATERFIPDLLIIDYPDLMRIDKDNYRLALDSLYKELRGIAVARNIALAVVSQSHRSAAKVKQVGADNVAEAYSKIAHADTIVTYSQSKQEKNLGLARLYVAGGRNDEDKITIVISQQYGIGGYVIDSMLMKGNYWENLPKGEDGDDE